MLDSLLAIILAMSFSVRTPTPKDTAIDVLDYQFAGKFENRLLALEAESERENACRYNNYEARGQLTYFKASWSHNEAHEIYRQEITLKFPWDIGKNLKYHGECGFSNVWHGINTVGNPTGYISNEINFEALKLSLKAYPSFKTREFESVHFDASAKFGDKFYCKPMFIYKLIGDKDYLQGKIEVGVELK